MRAWLLLAGSSHGSGTGERASTEALLMQRCRSIEFNQEMEGAK